MSKQPQTAENTATDPKQDPKFKEFVAFLQELMEKVHTGGYVDGATDVVSQHHATMTNYINRRVDPCLQAYGEFLSGEFKTDVKIRANHDHNAQVLSVAVLIGEEAYLRRFEDLHRHHRWLEKFLFDKFPELSDYTIQITNITYSDDTPINQGLLIADFPYKV